MLVKVSDTYSDKYKCIKKNQTTFKSKIYR